MVASIPSNPERRPLQATLRARVWLLRTIVGVVAVLLAGGLWYLSLQLGSRSEPIVSGAPSVGGPFTLINAEGKQVTDRDFLGEYMLIYFGYTFCPDVCPTTLSKMASALEKLDAKGDRVQMLFITIDPRRDTPAVIGQYITALSPHLICLTGTGEQIAAVEKGYRVYAAEHRTGNNPNDYTMDHSGIVYLMGPDGRFVALIRADDDADSIAADISRNVR